MPDSGPSTPTPELLQPAPPLSPTAAVQNTRWLAFATCLSLIVLGLSWELWLAPTGRGTLAIKVLPLLLALPGLWRMRLYTYRWLSLAIWLYSAEALVRISGVESRLVTGLAALELLLSVLLFAACALHVRHRLAAGRALNPSGQDAAH